ncbi:unnamed protein product, partial [Heterosigma akashiwo]
GSLSVVQVNLQHKKDTLHALWVYALKEDIDVILVQEPYVLGEDWLPGMPPMYARAIAPRPRDEDGVVIGMQLVAVVFKRDLPLLQDGDMTDRYTAAAVMRSDQPVYFMSSYMARSICVEHSTRKWVQKESWQRHRPRLLLSCDANAHSPLWFSATEDRRGREVEAFAAAQGLRVVNRESPFTTFDGARGATNIDVVLAGPALRQGIADWQVVPGQSDSDHNYVRFSLALRRKAPSCTREIAQYSHRRMDAHRLRKEVGKGLEAKVLEGVLGGEPASPAERDQLVSVLTEVLWEAFKVATPKRKRPHWKKSVAWWSPELEEVKRAYYRARHRRRRSRQCWIQYQKSSLWAEWRRAKRKAKSSSWQKFCSEVMDPLERMLQILKGTRASPVSTIKGTDGKVIADPEESVRTLLDSFWPDASQGDVEGDSELGRAREELELRAKDFEEKCRARLPDQGERKFTEDEVRWTMMRRRGFKAPGPD